MAKRKDQTFEEFLEELSEHTVGDNEAGDLEPYQSARDFGSVCVHEYMHLETKKKATLEEDGTQVYRRADEFVCRRCLNFELVVREHEGRNAPDWY